MTADPNQVAADEVWQAFPPDLRGRMNYDDFLLGFKLGRASAFAHTAKHELLHADDPVVIFRHKPNQTTNQTTNTNHE